MYMKLVAGIVRYELYVWMRNISIRIDSKNHFDLDSVKNKNKTSTNKKSILNKDYHSLFLFSSKII